MSNELKASMKESIKVLRESGHSNREISRLLNIHRNTVNRYVSLQNSKCATVTPGNSGAGGPSKCANVTAGKSRCEKYRGLIEDGLKAGLTAQRIYQDLVACHGFKAGYQSVKRFVRYFERGRELPFRRMETSPGEEVQVDFGCGNPVVDGGKRRRTHLFRIVLSCSRKGYSEVVFSQSAENFIRALENSFLHFGGVPSRVVIDNLKAGVLRADWFDPELNPKILDFCRHYGTAILPTRPGIPRHKGKVERGVGYAQDNALKGRVFGSLAEQNRFLLEWEESTADTRIHGTTREQVRAAFEREKPHLKALPPGLFPCFEEGRRIVHRDGYVEVKGAYYSVPWEYTGREVWVRWDGRIVRVFNMRHGHIAVHARQGAGRFATAQEHVSEKKRSATEKGQEWLVRRISLIGPGAEAWAKAMLANRGEIGLRVCQGLLSMAKKHKAADMESGCRGALDAGAFRLRDVRNFMVRDYEQEGFQFMEEHPLIRKLDFYGKIVSRNERNEPDEQHAVGRPEEAQAVGNAPDN